MPLPRQVRLSPVCAPPASRPTTWRHSLTTTTTSTAHTTTPSGHLCPETYSLSQLTRFIARDTPFTRC